MFLMFASFSFHCKYFYTVIIIRYFYDIIRTYIFLNVLLSRFNEPALYSSIFSKLFYYFNLSFCFLICNLLLEKENVKINEIQSNKDILI